MAEKRRKGIRRPSRSRQSGDDEGRGDDVAQGEAEGHVEAVLGAVRAQQADVLGAPDVEVERRPELESHLFLFTPQLRRIPYTHVHPEAQRFSSFKTLIIKTVG